MPSATTHCRHRSEDMSYSLGLSLPVDNVILDERNHFAISTEIELISQMNNMIVDRLIRDHEGRSETTDALRCFQQALERVNGLPIIPHRIQWKLHSDDQIKTQRSNSNNDEGTKTSYMYQRGEYDEGMHVYTDLAIIDLDALVSCESIIAYLRIKATLLYNLGLIYLSINEDNNAREHFLDALTTLRYSPIEQGIVFASSFESSSVSVVATLHNIGYIQYRKGEHKKCLRTFNDALDVARTTYGLRSLEVALTMNCLGVLYFHLPKAETEKCMGLYMEALSIQKEVYGTTHNKNIGTTLNNIGRVSYMTGDYDKALQAYSESLVIRRRLLGKDHLDVAATIYNAGQTYHQRGNLTEALQLYEEFTLIALPKIGSEHRDVAIMYKCMAQIHHERGNYDSAIAFYEKALQSGRSALGEMHPEVASTLNKMGNLYYEMGNFEAAIRMYQQGLEVERSVLHSLHPNITVTLTNIGQIYKHRGEFHSALRLYEEALTIQRQSLGSTHPSIAITLSSMALIHYQNRRYQMALDLYQETLRIRRDAYGDIHLDVASTINSIGLVLFKLGLHEMAMESFIESLRMRQKLLGNGHRDVAIILYNIATVHLERGDDDEAMKCYKETLRLEQTSLGPDHVDVVLTLQHIAQVHQQRGELHESLKYYMESIRIQKTYLTDLPSSTDDRTDPSNIAQTLNNVANVHLQLGNTAGVMEALSEAVRMYRSIGRTEDELNLTGFHLYGLSKLHPECAASA